VLGAAVGTTSDGDRYDQYDSGGYYQGGFGYYA